MQTDKASMLDEAIEYLKSLQLQLQVEISMNLAKTKFIVQLVIQAATDK